MKITREETAPREVVLNIEFDSDDIEPYLDRSYKRVVNRLQVPGFRPGKAPRYLVENYVGREALVRESLDFIMQESLDRALKEEDLEAFGEPDVEVVEIDPLSFKAVVPLEPIVELGDLSGLHLEPEPVEVTQEQVDGVLEQTRYNSAPWEPVDRPVRFRDLVNLDVDAFIEGKRVANDKGIEFIPDKDNPSPLPGFSVHIEGLKKDDSKEFTLQVPDDYADNKIVGKECRFNIKVLEIKEKALPELDDEFAKGVGDGYESLEGLRESILEDLRKQAERASQRAFQEDTLTQVINGASVEVPGLITDREIDHMLEEQLQAIRRRRVDMDTYLKDVGKSQEELRESLRPAAQERLTRALVVRKLAKDEGLEASDEEIDTEIEDLVSHSGESGDGLRKMFSSENARSSIGNAILQRKVLERLAEIVQREVEDSTVALEEEPSEPEEDQQEEETDQEGATAEAETVTEAGTMTEEETTPP